MSTVLKINSLSFYMIVFCGTFSLVKGSSAKITAVNATLLSLFTTYLISYFDTCFKKDGRISPYFQRLSIWKAFAEYFCGSITVEEKLDDSQKYIFCSFPHGTCSVSHILTMTDGCGMLSKVHRGERRDLAATVLFYLPIVRDFALAFGNVDASSFTASYNLQKGRSILIFIGGEKEQLMTTPGKHKIFLKSRKGFVKLAIQYGVPLVPMYAFGENQTYSTTTIFAGLQHWLQKSFQIGIPICWGRFGSCIPHKVPLNVELGKPIRVEKKSKEMITDEDVNLVHDIFVQEIKRLFDRTKIKYGQAFAELEIF